MMSRMGSPLRLGVLDYGTFEVAEDGRRIPIRGYLIVAADRVVLVDTGFPASYADDPVAAGRRDGLDVFGRLVSLSAENLPPAQLALAGLAPRDVTDLVLTHGDIDHVGGLDGFPHATLIVSRAERDAGPPRYFGDLRPVAWPAEPRYRLVESDEDLLPGVTLLSTPGHSPGHLSLLVRLPRTGAVLLAGDAISRPAELHSGVTGGAWDPALARVSAERLRRLASLEGALLVYGHDPDREAALLTVPVFYD
jgi:N-acyl homoserine lactone hydrolase